MAATGDTLTMPDGTSFLIVESAADSGGQRIEFEITMAPGVQGPPKHFHPRQHESWTVLEGELCVFVDDEWRTMAEGKTSSIPPATVHTLRNRSGGIVRFRDVHEPTLDFQEYIEALSREASAGTMTDRMTPSTLIPWRNGPAPAPDHPAQRALGTAGRRDGALARRAGAWLATCARVIDSRTNVQFDDQGGTTR